MSRLIIYQLFPRIFTNNNEHCIPWGTIGQNGSGKLNDMDSHLLRSLKELGVNCLWLTGIIEHATKTAYPEFGIPADNPNIVKGEAGSPYAIKDYYDIDPALAESVPDRMKEFEALVKRIHCEGMRVAIDFVPNHTARIYHSDAAPKGVEDFGAHDDISMYFSPSNNYYYLTNQQFYPNFPLDAEGEVPYVEFPAKATGNDCFTAFCGIYDWYETVKLNYGHDYYGNRDYFDPVPDTWIKMLNILKFWASKGVDGFRCDMVFMVPLAFWHWVIPQVKALYPHVFFLGEIYDVGQYREFIDYGCFDYLYDKVNLYDTLVGIETKGWSAAQITGCWQTVDGIGDRMLNFLENHDEVRFASKSFADDAMRVVPYLVTSTMISKGPVLIYYGQELGEKGAYNEGFAGYNDRTTIFDYWSMDVMRRWYNHGKCNGDKLSQHEKWLRNLYGKVLNLCNNNAPLREGAFFDLMYVNLRQEGFDPHSHFAFIRYTKSEAVIVVVNFSRDAETAIKINIPGEAFEIIGLPKGEFTVAELLWGKSQRVFISPVMPLTVNVKASDAVVLPIKL